MLARTLVDLPGLIHATNKAQTETDKELILNLVKEYMKNPRTIILAVVSAKNDYANQIILDHCRKIDEQGRRTLGIITKPDFLREGTDNEQAWIELAQNKDIYLERGWHMLKNRGDDQMKFSFEERNADEDLFFSKGRYADLPRECVGIDSLRERLSKVLLNHLIKELPSLKDEMVSKLQSPIAEIEKLGDKRDTTHEQRMVLMKISMRISDTLKSATQGYYESPFFGSINMDAAIDAPENIRRFRAVIQYLNIQFANDMRLRGHKYAFGAGPGDEEREIEEDRKVQEELDNVAEHPRLVFLPRPTKLTRQQAIEWVKNNLERSRGHELPGTFQPMLISQLFWEQSQPWEQIASQHVTTIASACKEFVDTVLQDAAPSEFEDKLRTLYVDGALTEALAGAQQELKKVLKDKARHPTTYNHYFTTTVQKMRQRKNQKITEKASEASEVSMFDPDYGPRTPLDPDKLAVAMDKAIEPDMDVFSSQEALDTERAFYKDEVKYFVSAVTKAVIERHLVEPLPEIILSPLVVTQMTEKEVGFVAAEPPEITQQRFHLESRKCMLERGLETFREAMGGLKR
ncbi:dynamin family protein [Alternaria alternata]|nr:dynamin family protein [Alternaria alternata]